MKANRQRLLTTISVVVDCWDRAKTHKDFAEQVGIHIEDLRDILYQESKAWLDKRTAHVPAKTRFRMSPSSRNLETLYKKGESLVQEFRKGKRQ